MGTEKLIIVSGDSHANMPPEAWPEYLESAYHDLLPQQQEDHLRYTSITSAFRDFKPEVLEFVDTDGAWASGGFHGVWDLDRRLEQMDREGIAAELVYYGDTRAGSLLHPAFRVYPQDVVAAGRRAFNRWLADTFGSATDRLLLCGDPGAGVDIDAMVIELEWTAEHGFAATYPPGLFARHELPPLHDSYFDPFWSWCEELGILLVVHAGFGTEPCEFMGKIENIKQRMDAEGLDGDVLAEMTDTEDFFALDLRPRQVMWQLMMGGVFDRHPKLKLLMTELRGDWLPATLHHLDAAYEKSRADLPAKRRPSEYWHSNCMVSVSFVHKAEVAIREEMGIETITFGRHDPHPEGTWPNTTDWLRDAYAGVPENELRMMLGENMIRFLDLDRAKLAEVAERIGPLVEDIVGSTPDIDPRLIANFDSRGGYLKPIEQINADKLDAMLRDDFALLAPGTA